MAFGNAQALNGMPNVNSNVKTTISPSCLLACRIMLESASSISPLTTALETQAETCNVLVRVIIYYKHFCCIELMACSNIHFYNIYSEGMKLLTPRTTDLQYNHLSNESYGIIMSQIHTKLYMQNKQNRSSFTYFSLTKNDHESTFRNYDFKRRKNFKKQTIHFHNLEVYCVPLLWIYQKSQGLLHFSIPFWELLM